MTEEEALALITRLLGDSHPIVLLPFEFGWLAERRLPPGERGRAPGQVAFIIDRDGTVTVQSSLSSRMLMSQYAEARLEGRIIGRQVWPEPDQPT